MFPPLDLTRGECRRNNWNEGDYGKESMVGVLGTGAIAPSTAGSSGLCRASKDPSGLSSRVEPEHRCHDDIPAFRYVIG